MKYIFSISILIITISISYYFLVLLPESKNKQLEFAKNKELLHQEQQCGIRGSKLHDKKRSESPTLLYFTPEFHFNEEKNKCFYFSGFMQDKYLERWVMNVDTQQVEVSFIENDNKIMSELNNEGFEKEKQDYFEE